MHYPASLQAGRDDCKAEHVTYCQYLEEFSLRAPRRRYFDLVMLSHIVEIFHTSAYGVATVLLGYIKLLSPGLTSQPEIVFNSTKGSQEV